MNGYPKIFLPLLMTTLGLLWITGIFLLPAWFIFRLEQDSDWLMTLSLATGDGRHWMTVSHALLGWLMIGFIGALWTTHIRVHRRKHENKASGLMMLVVLLGLILSAMGIYYLGNATASLISSVAHVGLGVVMPAMLLMHRRLGQKSLKNAQK